MKAQVKKIWAVPGLTLITLLAATPALAIVSTNSPTNWVGTGLSYLDGEAFLTLSRSDGTFVCSGSLLAGGQYVLTAAHCVTGSADTATTSSVSLSFKSGSVTSTVSGSNLHYYVDPSWTGNLRSGNDLALIKLSTPITSITGYTLDASSAQGQTVTLAGSGNTGTGATGYVNNTYGTLHYGYNQYDATAGFYTANSFASSIYLYDFDGAGANVFGSSGLGSNQEALIGTGDSGGGTLINVNGVWQLAGVHSFISGVASFGSIAGDISLAAAANYDWVMSYAAIAAVPEPGSLALLLGALGLGYGRRTRRRSAT